MADLLPIGSISQDEYERDFKENDVVIKVARTTKVVAGGKRMSFAALTVIGNKNGKVGWGYGKAKEVPFAVEKAIQAALKNVIKIPLAHHRTIPHTVENKFRATRVVIMPASSGTGLKAGTSVRAVLSSVGVKDALSKLFNSKNPVNSVKAAFEALRTVRSLIQSEKLRGIQIFERKLVTAEEAASLENKPVQVKPSIKRPLSKKQFRSRRPRGDSR